MICHWKDEVSRNAYPSREAIAMVGALVTTGTLRSMRITLLPVVITLVIIASGIEEILGSETRGDALES